MTVCTVPMNTQKRPKMQKAGGTCNPKNMKSGKMLCKKERWKFKGKLYMETNMNEMDLHIWYGMKQTGYTPRVWKIQLRKHVFWWRLRNMPAEKKNVKTVLFSHFSSLLAYTVFRVIPNLLSPYDKYAYNQRLRGNRSVASYITPVNDSSLFYVEEAVWSQRWRNSVFHWKCRNIDDYIDSYDKTEFLAIHEINRVSGSVHNNWWTDRKNQVSTHLLLKIDPLVWHWNLDWYNWLYLHLFMFEYFILKSFFCNFFFTTDSEIGAMRRC